MIGEKDFITNFSTTRIACKTFIHCIAWIFQVTTQFYKIMLAVTINRLQEYLASKVILNSKYPNTN